MRTQLYLQAPMGLETNEEMVESLIPFLNHEHVAAFLCHSPGLVEHYVDAGCRDVAFMMPHLDDKDSRTYPDAIEGLHSFDPNISAPQVKKKSKGYSFGVGPIDNRHDAMVLGEAGADYIAFPASKPELIEWWAQNFELPCVAWGVSREDQLVALKEIGADFIMPAPILLMNLDSLESFCQKLS